MRIIAFTDIHGAYERVNAALRARTDHDVVVIGGDLTTRAEPEEAESALNVLRQMGKPIFAVAGNMDLPAVEDRYRRLGVSLNATGLVIDDVGFFGVSGSPPTPMKTPYEISEEEIARRSDAGWQRVQSARWRVFVPHVPPRRTALDRTFLGTHVGSTAVRTFVERAQPDVLICGHIHEARGTDRLGRTIMINCGAGNKGHYAVIEIGDEIRVENHTWPE